MPSAPDASPAWFPRLVAARALDPLVANVEAGGASSCRGAAGSSTAFVAAALAKRSGRPLLLITAHADEAEEAVAEINDLAAAGLAPDAALLPALESMPGEGGAALDLLAERLTMVRRLAEGRGRLTLIAGEVAMRLPWYSGKVRLSPSPMK